MDIGKPLEVVEIEEPAMPFEGEEVSPGYQPEEVPQEAPAEVGAGS